MKVIKPIAIDTNLVSSTAVEPTAAYSAGTTYAAGAQVHVVADKRVYQSLQAANTGNTPASSPLWWVDVGPMNAWAMFDAEVSTQTTATSTLTVAIDPGYINSIALFGLVGQQLQIDITNGAGGANVYSRTINLDGTTLSDWYQYYFEPSVQLGDLVRLDLPPYGAARLTLTITGSGTVAIGHMVLGTAYDLGGTQYGASVGITDYSRVTTDEFGVTTIVRRRTAKTMDARMDLPTGQINKVNRVLSSLASVLAVYVGADADSFAPLIVFGLGTFRVEVAGPSLSYCSLEVKGRA